MSHAFHCRFSLCAGEFCVGAPQTCCSRILHCLMRSTCNGCGWNFDGILRERRRTDVLFCKEQWRRYRIIISLSFCSIESQMFSSTIRTKIYYSKLIMSSKKRFVLRRSSRRIKSYWYQTGDQSHLFRSFLTVIRVIY